MIKPTMASSKFNHFIFFTFLFSLAFMFHTITSADVPPLYIDCLTNKGNYTTNSIYSKNLKTILSSISSLPKNDNGFYNLSVGQKTDRVNAIALCRRDVKSDVCLDCLKSASNGISDICSSYKEAIIGYDDCMLRYSNRSILKTMEPDPLFALWNVNNVSDPDGFNQSLSSLLVKLRSEAAASGSKYASGSINVTHTQTQTIYGLMQCTPDLSEKQCGECLSVSMGEIPRFLSGKQGGRIIVPSCNFRYEIDLFYDPLDDNIQPSSAPQSPTRQISPAPQSPAPQPPAPQPPAPEVPAPQPPSTKTSPAPAPKGNDSNTSKLLSSQLLLLLSLLFLSSVASASSF